MSCLSAWRSILARIQAALMKRLNILLGVYISFPEATSERPPQAERAGTEKAPAAPSCFHLSCVMRRWGARAFCSVNVPAKSGREREVSSPPNIQKEKTASKQIFFEKSKHGSAEDELRRGSGDALIRDVAGTLG